MKGKSARTESPINAGTRPAADRRGAIRDEKCLCFSGLGEIVID